MREHLSAPLPEQKKKPSGIGRKLKKLGLIAGFTGAIGGLGATAFEAQSQKPEETSVAARAEIVHKEDERKLAEVRKRIQDEIISFQHDLARRGNTPVAGVAVENDPFAEKDAGAEDEELNKKYEKELIAEEQAEKLAKNIKERFGDSVVVGEMEGGKIELRRKGTEETEGRDIPLISIYVNEDGAYRIDGTVGGEIVLKPDDESPYSFDVTGAVDNPVIPAGPDQERLLGEAIRGATNFKDKFVQAVTKREATSRTEESGGVETEESEEEESG